MVTLIIVKIKYNFYNSSKERELLTCWQIQKPIRMQKVDENQKHLNACNFHSSTSTCAQNRKIEIYIDNTLFQ